MNVSEARLMVAFASCHTLRQGCPDLRHSTIPSGTCIYPLTCIGVLSLEFYHILMLFQLLHLLEVMCSCRSNFTFSTNPNNFSSTTTEIPKHLKKLNPKRLTAGNNNAVQEARFCSICQILLHVSCF